MTPGELQAALAKSRAEASGLSQSMIDAGKYVAELRAEVAALRQTLVAAETWIHAVPHGDNCYVCNHYEGDPGNQCNCGRESALAMIAASLDAARAAMREGT